MSIRFLVGAAVLLCAATQANAQRYIGFGGQGTPESGGDFYIGAQTLGSATVTTILGPATLAPFENGFQLRDRFVPAIGIANVAKRGDPVPGNGNTNMHMFFPDTTQFWVSTDQKNWQFLQSNGSVTVNGIFFVDWGGYPNSFQFGSVPAVSIIGLIAMFAALAGAGGYIVVRRTSASIA